MMVHGVFLQIILQIYIYIDLFFKGIRKLKKQYVVEVSNEYNEYQDSKSFFPLEFVTNPLCMHLPTLCYLT